MLRNGRRNTNGVTGKVVRALSVTYFNYVSWANQLYAAVNLYADDDLRIY